MDENIRLLATAVVIIIFLSLSWLYRTSIKTNLQHNANSPAMGLVILILSLAIAWWWMNSSS